MISFSFSLFSSLILVENRTYGCNHVSQGVAYRASFLPKVFKYEVNEPIRFCGFFVQDFRSIWGITIPFSDRPKSRLEHPPSLDEFLWCFKMSGLIYFSLHSPQKVSHPRIKPALAQVIWRRHPNDPIQAAWSSDNGRPKYADQITYRAVIEDNAIWV